MVWKGVREEKGIGEKISRKGSSILYPSPHGGVIH